MVVMPAVVAMVAVVDRGRRHAHHLLVLLVGVSIGAQRVQVWVLQSLVLERVKAMAYQFGNRSCNANEVLRNRAQCANAKLQNHYPPSAQA